ncbi:aldose epimerase family protein [Dactylosporangium sp. NPDC051541]|uniref:aldose epimerase family protein n=1 Tax=Dactylosporangium sp. NPDC051541 TaxID=3363977 RepID=UPI00379F8FC5
MTGVAAGARPVSSAGDQDPIGLTEFWLDNGWMRVGVLDYGATVVDVQVPDRAGVRGNVAVRLPAVTDYLATADRAYVGSTMGRFARMVPHGVVDLDGREHRLAPNAGPHHIHGGPTGFDARVWAGEAAGGDDAGRIVLTLSSPDGDQGYPGTLTCRAEFTLDRRNRLTIRYEAVTDRTTLCGLTTHAFWNLAAGGTVDDQRLRLSADGVLEQLRGDGPEVLPTGRILPVAGTPSDLRAPRRLRGVALDGFFALSGGSRAGAGEVRAAELSDPASGRRMVVDTDQSGMAVYTGDHLPGRARAGLCLQPGPWPYVRGASAIPGSLLRPGQTYRSSTTFGFDGAGDDLL